MLVSTIILKRNDIMSDINIAKSQLHNINLSIVVVKDGKVIEESTDRGIKPIYDIYTVRKENLKNAVVADKVIGKAAAMLLSNAGIKMLYTDLISDKAIEVLDKSNIEYEFAKRVPVIFNRDGSDMCPIEKLSSNTDNVEELIEKIRIFINNINK